MKKILNYFFSGIGMTVTAALLLAGGVYLWWTYEPRPELTPFDPASDRKTSPPLVQKELKGEPKQATEEEDAKEPPEAKPAFSLWNREWGYFLVDGKGGKELLTSLGIPDEGGLKKLLSDSFEWSPELNRIQNQLVFVDPEDRRWVVPKGEANNGASVPQFVRFLIPGGLNTQAKFAAIVHDHYCAREEVRRRDAVGFTDIHRMFYHAMRASRIEHEPAIRMYAAVVKFGPPKDRSVLFRLLAQLNPEPTPDYRERLFESNIGGEVAAVFEMDTGRIIWKPMGDTRKWIELNKQAEALDYQFRNHGTIIVSQDVGPPSAPVSKEELRSQLDALNSSIGQIEQSNPEAANWGIQMSGKRDESFDDLAAWWYFILENSATLQPDDVDRLAIDGIPEKTE